MVKVKPDRSVRPVRFD